MRAKIRKIYEGKDEKGRPFTRYYLENAQGEDVGSIREFGKAQYAVNEKIEYKSDGKYLQFDVHKTEEKAKEIKVWDEDAPTEITREAHCQNERIARAVAWKIAVEICINMNISDLKMNETLFMIAELQRKIEKDLLFQ